MPYWIQSGYDYSRMAVLDSQPELRDSFWRPYVLGYPLTPELLSRVPDPLYFRPPELEEVPELVIGGKGGAPTTGLSAKK